MKIKELRENKCMQAALAVLFSVLLCLLAFLLDNRGILGLPGEERGTRQVSGQVTEEGTRIELSGGYVDRLSFAISGEIRVKPSAEEDWITFPVGSRTLDLEERICPVSGPGEEAAGEEACYVVYDKNPAALTRQYLPLGERVESVTVRAVEPGDFDDSAGPAQEEGKGEWPAYDLSGVSFSDFQVINRLHFNPYLCLFVLAVSLCFSGILIFGRTLIRKPEYGVLLILLTIGVTMAVCLPKNKVGNDEETHLQAVMDMAGIPGELHISDTILNSLMVTEYNDPDYQPGTREEMELFDSWLSGTGDYKAGENTPDFYTMPGRMPAYAFMALFVKLAKGLSLSWSGVFLAGRLGNLLLYTGLMFLAVRRTPVGKYLLLLIALFPENVFLACTYSYDPFITGCLSLGTAAFLRELFRRKGTADWKNVCLMLLAFFLGCLPKAVYAPLLLMALLLPAAGFRRKGGSLLYRLAVAGLFCMLLATFILPTVLAPAETGDLRGGATSEVSQVGYILSNPLDYALVLISQMIRWIPQCFFGPDCTTFMGHLVSGYTEFKGYWPVYLLLLAAVVLLGGDRPEDGEEASSARAFRLPERAWILLTAGASAVLIWTSMYVAFTEPGAREIAGVQGRYFIPLMYPLYLLPAHRGKLVRVPDICYHLIVGILAGALALTVWTTVLSRFCL